MSDSPCMDNGIDISASGLSALAQARVRDQIDTRVAKKALDVQKQQGDAVVELLKSAAETASPDGTGSRLDVSA